MRFVQDHLPHKILNILLQADSALLIPETRKVTDYTYNDIATIIIIIIYMNVKDLVVLRVEL